MIVVIVAVVIIIVVLVFVLGKPSGRTEPESKDIRQEIEKYFWSEDYFLSSSQARVNAQDIFTEVGKALRRQYVQTLKLFNIQEDALISEPIVGYSQNFEDSVSSDDDPFFKKGVYRREKAGLVLADHQFSFILLTNERLSVSGMHYNVVNDDVCGDWTEEFLHRHLLSVKGRDGQITLTFADGSKIVHSHPQVLDDYSRIVFETAQLPFTTYSHVISTLRRIVNSARDQMPAPKEKETVKEKETIREIVKIRCSHCKQLYEESKGRCPYCGGT